MSKAVPSGGIVLTSGWPSYLTLSALPVFFVILGFLAALKITFGPTEIAIFFVLPAIVEAVALIKLRASRMELSQGKLLLRRFVFHSLSLREEIISNDEIVFGVLSNGLGNKFAIEQRSGLKIVPVSVLYLEYRSGKAVQKLAFDVSSFDNRQVADMVARFPKISRAHYGNLPSL
jgi:hypothetical protein